MAQPPTEDEIRQAFPAATKPRAYLYPEGDCASMSVVEWGTGVLGRRVAMHRRAGQWAPGFPAARPDAGWPLYASDRWRDPVVYVVASEREVYALERIGLSGTTWCGRDPGQARWSDWSTIEGRSAVLWLPDSHAAAVATIVPTARRIGLPPVLEWMRGAWERHAGDADAIREGLRWVQVEEYIGGSDG